MYPERAMPISLKIVAVLYILAGVHAVIEIAGSLMRGHVHFNPGVLGFFIGLGLLRRSPSWHYWALFFTRWALIILPIIALLFMVHLLPPHLKILGLKVAYDSQWIGLAVLAALFALALWLRRVLTRSDIRDLFGVDIE